MNRNSFATTTLSVSQLTMVIKEYLEGQFPLVSVQGEISNFKLQSSGHCYFSLKDAQAQVSAVMFRTAATTLERMPRDGDQVTVVGQLNVYAPRGQYQIVVRTLRFSGLGELLLKLEELKLTLQARGWFDAARKRPLPPFPQRIGVVTSPTGAALQDMLNILRRRQASFHLVLNPVRVQGKEAAAEIAQAIRQFSDYQCVDVVIVGRGGGSIEDLWPFNEECVVHAIVESRIPVISAVGHETDWCLSDFASDLRAPTPSAAAEIVTADKLAQIDFLQSCASRLRQTMFHLLTHVRTRLHRFQTHPLFTSPYPLLGRPMQQCDDLRLSLDQGVRGLVEKRRLALHALSRQAVALRPTARLQRDRLRLEEVRERLDHAMHGRLERAKERMEGLGCHLQSVNPKNLLKKGYAILFAEKRNRVVSSVCSLSIGERVEALLSDGSAHLTVESLEKKRDD